MKIVARVINEEGAFPYDWSSDWAMPHRGDIIELSDEETYLIVSVRWKLLDEEVIILLERLV